MKSISIKDKIVFKNEEGITIKFDEDFAKQYASENGQTCVALIEPNMGFGVFFTQDCCVGAYGTCLYKRKVLHMFWRENEEQIDEWFENAYNEQGTLEALIDVGISILVSLTEEILEESSEAEKCVGA